MGVYVKGMEMPHDCGDCDFLSGLICPDNVYHCYAPVDNKNHSIDVTVFVENWQRPLWCPLVEVPMPRGRLIDADKLFAIVKRHHDLYKGATVATDKARRDENLQVMFDIADAKTLMEAEK